jgi:hypothetical protein
VSVDATVTKSIDHVAGPELVHAWKIAFVPERSFDVRASAPEKSGANRASAAPQT